MLFLNILNFVFIFQTIIFFFFSFKISKDSSWLIPSLVELLINISMQSSLFLAKYNNLLRFFFLNFVSCYNFIIIPKDKENGKENTEVIRPNNGFINITKNISP